MLHVFSKGPNVVLALARFQTTELMRILTVSIHVFRSLVTPDRIRAVFRKKLKTPSNGDS